MPGWGRRAAQDAVAETGVDMTRFRTGGHLASWAGKHPAGQPVRQAQRDGPRPRRATGTWPPSPARPPPRSAKPRPAKAPATGGWPAAAARPKPCVATGNTQLKVYHGCCLTPVCAIRTSARTTTSASATSAARSPTTSASSAPSASKSPWPGSPNPNQTRQADPDRLTHTALTDPGQPVTAKVRCRAPRLGSIFGSATTATDTSGRQRTSTDVARQVRLSKSGGRRHPALASGRRGQRQRIEHGRCSMESVRARLTPRH